MKKKRWLTICDDSISLLRRETLYTIIRYVHPGFQHRLYRFFWSVFKPKHVLTEVRVYPWAFWFALRPIPPSSQKTHCILLR